MKIVNLVLYNDDVKYVKMRNILQKHYAKYQNVTTIFYKYDNSLQNDIELCGDILNIKGQETYIPGILEKTIVAIEYILKNVRDYDYIVRSNISSVIDFKLLCVELKHDAIEFYGGTRFGKILPGSDVKIDPKYVHTPYASGTNIILSKKGSQILIENKHLIKKEVVDDIAIGVLFKDMNVKHKEIVPHKFVFVPNMKMNSILFQKIMEEKFILYRNMNGDREIDILQMTMITDYLAHN